MKFIIHGMMATPSSVQTQGLTLKQFVTTENGYVFELGVHILIMICFTIPVFRVISPRIKKEYIFFLSIGILSTFMATKYFPWKLLGEGFAMIQFPWRLMTVSNFCFSIICSINMGVIIKRFNFKDACFLGIIAIAFAASLHSFIPQTKEDVVDVEKYDGIGFVSGKQEDTLAGQGKSEYLPKKAYDNLFYVASRESGIMILDGRGYVKTFNKNGNKLNCELEIYEDKTVFEFPYIYYPGYKVTLDGSPINSFESENGFLAIVLNKMPKSDIEVEYTGTKLMKMTKIFSIISCILFGVYIFSLKESKSPLLDNGKIE